MGEWKDKAELYEEAVKKAYTADKKVKEKDEEFRKAARKYEAHFPRDVANAMSVQPAIVNLTEMAEACRRSANAIIDAKRELFEAFRAMIKAAENTGEKDLIEHARRCLSQSLGGFEHLEAIVSMYDSPEMYIRINWRPVV